MILVGINSLCKYSIFLDLQKYRKKYSLTLGLHSYVVAPPLVELARARETFTCAHVLICTTCLPGFEMDTVSAAAGDDSEIGGLCEHVIRGVSVTFPFDPYSCQLVYMEKVIHALQEV